MSDADTTTDEVYDATAAVKGCVFVVTETESDGTEGVFRLSHPSEVRVSSRLMR